MPANTDIHQVALEVGVMQDCPEDAAPREEGEMTCMIDNDISQETNDAVIPQLHLGSELQITYSGLDQNAFDEKYSRIKPEPWNIKNMLRSIRRNCKCSSACVRKSLSKKFPIIGAMRHYRFRRYILGDVVAGLSLGVMTIPMSLAFALLASLPPIIGLYTAFIAPVVYFFLGTSRHLSIGTMALSSLVISAAVSKGTAGFQQLLAVANSGLSDQNNVTMITGTVNLSDYGELYITDSSNKSQTIMAVTKAITDEKISIAMSMSFLSGIILIVVSLLKLGFWAAYISDPFISGYMTGTNVHVMTHQIRHMLGVETKSYAGPLGYCYFLRDILLELPRTNIATLVMSIIACVLLFCVKKFINEKFKDRLAIPIPIDMIVVVFATVISHFCQMEESFGMKIVQEVPKGLPNPSLPSLHHMKDFWVESIVLALNCYIMVLVLVKIFSQRHNYPYDATQEMLATGMCATIGAFFTGMAASASPPRCFLMESSGGRSQIAHLLSACLVLLTLFLLAPLLESLPICILACLIFVSCLPLIEHYRKSIYYFRMSKYDFSIWLVTAMSSVLVGVDYGMFIGIGFSFLVTVYRTQRPYISSMVVDVNEGVLLDAQKYGHIKTQVVPGVYVFRFESPLYFASIDIFRAALYRATVDPARYVAKLQQMRQEEEEIQREKEEARAMRSSRRSVQSSVSYQVPDNYGHDDFFKPLKIRRPKWARHHHRHPVQITDIKAIVVDAAVIQFADTSGANILGFMHQEYRKAGIIFAVAEMNETVRSLVMHAPACAELARSAIYPSVQDAIIALHDKDLAPNMEQSAEV